ncbi:MAG: arsenic efflux protein [Bacteroidales bacterium]|jgi:hypothetical protein|nr:arsenic efflux protein [Bacteroidales bacterium]
MKSIIEIVQNITWKPISQETLLITSFVIIMMLLIELINVSTRKKIEKLLNKNSIISILTGTLFGLFPGCMGTFVIVTLYSEGLVSFGTLIATMIATVGDEAFFMIAVMPEKSILIFSILAIIAIIVGLLCDKIFKIKINLSKHNFKHEHSLNNNNHNCSETHENTFSVKNIHFSKYKIIIFSLISAIIVLSATNIIAHSNSQFESSTFLHKNTETSHLQHDEDCQHLNLDNKNHEHGSEAFVIKILLIVVSGILLILLLFSNEHFIKNHLWQHLIKKHFLKIFLWIFITLIAINIIFMFGNFNEWISNNYFIMLLIAILIGIIPQSGPNLIFISLFVGGTIPFSILLANSVVQDGHGGLPLLAESKKSFFIKKGISIGIVFVIGILAYFCGF